MRLHELPRELNRSSIFLVEEEVKLVYECELSTDHETLMIYKVAFDYDFTFNVGYIYIGENEEGFYRSSRYYRSPKDIEKSLKERTE